MGALDLHALVRGVAVMQAPEASLDSKAACLGYVLAALWGSGPRCRKGRPTVQNRAANSAL